MNASVLCHAAPFGERGRVDCPLSHMAIAVLLERQIKPENVNDMQAYLEEILPDTRAYEGCQGLDVCGNMDDGTHLVLYERWETRPHDETYLA